MVRFPKFSEDRPQNSRAIKCHLENCLNQKAHRKNMRHFMTQQRMHQEPASDQESNSGHCHWKWIKKLHAPCNAAFSERSSVLQCFHSSSSASESSAWRSGKGLAKNDISSGFDPPHQWTSDLYMSTACRIILPNPHWTSQLKIWQIRQHRTRIEYILNTFEYKFCGRFSVYPVGTRPMAIFGPWPRAGNHIASDSSGNSEGLLGATEVVNSLAWKQFHVISRLFNGSPMFHVWYRFQLTHLWVPDSYVSTCFSTCSGPALHVERIISLCMRQKVGVKVDECSNVGPQLM